MNYVQERSEILDQMLPPTYMYLLRKAYSQCRRSSGFRTRTYLFQDQVDITHGVYIHAVWIQKFIGRRFEWRQLNLIQEVPNSSEPYG